MPTSYIYNLSRFPQGNVAEIDISIKVYRQFILSLQGITWFSFPSREEQYQQWGWWSAGGRQADADTTLITLAAMHNQSWSHTAVIWVAHPCPFPLARPQKMVRANVHLQSSVSSWVSIIFQVSILLSLLVSKNTVRCERDSSDVFSELVSLLYASSVSVHLQLKHCWRLDSRCWKWGDGLLEN